MRQVTMADVHERKATLLHSIDGAVTRLQRLIAQVRDVGRNGDAPDEALRKLAQLETEVDGGRKRR